MNELLERYAKLETKMKLSCEKVSSELEIPFSKEFKKIADECRFDYLGRFEWFSFNNDGSHSVIGDTLRLRQEVNLPKDTLILAEDDASLLFMKCLGDREEIYWISTQDGYNYCDGQPLLNNPIIFSNFIDFFTYLLNEEEEMRQEEAPK